MRAAPLFTVILLTAGVTSEKAQEQTPRLSLADAGRVTEGDAFTLRCEVRGEGWKFLWFKVSEGGVMFDSATGGTYTVRSAALVNSGQYWCFAGRNDGLYYVSNGLSVQVTVSSTTPLTTASSTAKTTAEKTDLAQASRSTRTPTPSNSERKTAVPAATTDQGKPHGSSLLSNTGLPVTARRTENTMLGSADQTNTDKQKESVFSSTTPLTTASSTAKTTAEKTDLAQASRSTRTPTPSNSERKTAVPAATTDQGKPHGSSLLSNTGLPVTARRAENTMLGSADQTNTDKQKESVFLQPWFLITAVLCSVLLVVSVILVLVYQPDQRYTVGHTATFRRRGVQLIRYMEQEEPPAGDTAMEE